MPSKKLVAKANETANRNPAKKASTALNSKTVREYSPEYKLPKDLETPFLHKVDMEDVEAKIKRGAIGEKNCEMFGLNKFDIENTTLYPLTSKMLSGLNQQWSAKTLYEMGHLPVYISIAEPKWDRVDKRYPCSEKARQAVRDRRFWSMQASTEDLEKYDIEHWDPYHVRGSNAARVYFKGVTFTKYTCVRNHETILENFDFYADLLHEDVQTIMAGALGAILRVDLEEAKDILISKFNGELSSLFMVDELWTINLELNCICSWTRTLAKDGNTKKMKKIGVRPDDAGSLFLKRVSPVVGPLGGRTWISTHEMTPSMRVAAAGAMWDGQCRLEKTEEHHVSYTCGGTKK